MQVASGRSNSLPFTLPPIIAHRGESGLAPENTLAAFQLAAANGASWVELDANISLDSIPYVHHDDSIERCTNSEGYLITHTSETLNSVDAGSWFDRAYKGEALPTLESVIQFLTKQGLGLNLEIKPTAGWEEPTTDAICELIKRQWPPELPLLLSSFSERALYRAAQHLPDVARGYLVAAIPEDWQTRVNELSCATLHCAAQCLLAEQAAAIKGAGLGLLCYTVNEADTARRLLSWGVDSIFTDYPSRLIPELLPGSGNTADT